MWSDDVRQARHSDSAQIASQGTNQRQPDGILHQCCLDSGDGLLKFLDRTGKGETHITRGTKRGARDQDDVSFVEEQLHEISIVGQPLGLHCACHPWERIESAFTLAALESGNLIQGFDDVVTAGLVGRDHLRNAGLITIEGCRVRLESEGAVDLGGIAATPADERASLEAEHRTLTTKLGERMEEWEALENQLAELPKP